MLSHAECRGHSFLKNGEKFLHLFLPLKQRIKTRQLLPTLCSSSLSNSHNFSAFRTTTEPNPFEFIPVTGSLVCFSVFSQLATFDDVLEIPLRLSTCPTPFFIAGDQTKDGTLPPSSTSSPGFHQFYEALNSEDEHPHFKSLFTTVMNQFLSS